MVIEEDTQIEDCIIMDYTVVRRGARLKRAIIDRNNCIATQTRIGFDAVADCSNYFVTESGITVLQMGPNDPHFAHYY